MFPIKYFSDLVANLDTIKDEFNPPFYVIVLYKEQNKEFRNHILSEFSKIHEFTGNVMFALVDQPPHEWLNREDISYFHDIMGNNYSPKLNNHEIDIICEYLRIDPGGLPYVIFFSDFGRKDFNQFSFKDADINTIERFFQHLLDSASKFSYQNLNYIELMRETRRQFPELKTKIEYIQYQYQDLKQLLYEIMAVLNSQFKTKQNETKILFKNTSPENTTRISTKIADKCRKKAIELWELYPEIDSTQEMAKHPEIEKIGGAYTVKTRQRWISRVSPEYATKPGRRSSKRK